VTSGNRIRNSLIVTAMVTASCVQTSGDRMETLGQAMICMCRNSGGGCGQLLSECNMIACPVSEPMRREVKAKLAQGMSDREILSAFSEKYGPRVRSAPGVDSWWNVLAWVTPFGALLGGAAVASLFVKRSLDRAPESSTSLLASGYENEIEEELRRHRPEE
jgi:cytochrome c-type biogenesis protein CcmH/NrfF